MGAVVLPEALIFGSPANRIPPFFQPARCLSVIGHSVPLWPLGGKKDERIWVTTPGCYWLLAEVMFLAFLSEYDTSI
jgi:hypothetical protein